MRASCLVAAAAVGALLLGVVPALAGTDVAPRISPKIGTPKTLFRVGFTAPEAAGHQGVVERSYSVELLVRGSSCSHAAVKTIPNADAGERLRLAFRPPRRGWCSGRGHGTVYQQEGPYCQQGEPCPLFPSTSKPIAHFSFRVR